MDVGNQAARTPPAAARAGRGNVVVGVLAVLVVLAGMGLAVREGPGASVLVAQPSVLPSVLPSTAGPVPSASGASAAPSEEPASGPSVPTGPRPSVPPSAGGAPTPSPVAPVAPDPGTGAASPPPPWLGGRPLAPAGSGPVAPQQTPPELLDRRIVTPERLPPPTSAVFSPQVSAVPPEVLDRSTWQPSCPVAVEDLRYVLVQHWGFDGGAHTGEVLVHADGVDVVVAVFAAMFDERFPVEEVRVVRADELDAAPTGDGNVTSAFVCRGSVGGGRWSRHAYGLALDVNPFHNPYDRGSGADRLVLPELATAYTDRDRLLPGMLTEGSAAVRAAEAAGWGWGGRWRSARDWMHLSDDGS